VLIGTPLPLSDAALPVTLPEMSSYAPAGDGQPPLASASADWLECVPCEKRISFLSASLYMAASLCFGFPRLCVYHCLLSCMVLKERNGFGGGLCCAGILARRPAGDCGGRRSRCHSGQALAGTIYASLTLATASD
jgi:hypothetical protein